MSDWQAFKNVFIFFVAKKNFLTRIIKPVLCGSIGIANQQGKYFFLAPAAFSNPEGPYPYGLLTLLGSPNLYLT